MNCLLGIIGGNWAQPLAGQQADLPRPQLAKSSARVAAPVAQGHNGLLNQYVLSKLTQ